MGETRNTANIRAARDQLVRLASEYDRAVDEFRWPEIGPTFNWATEWFDVIAEKNDRPALRIVEEDGSEATYSFSDLSSRSDVVAGRLSAHGIQQGDRVMVMLGNQVELWESVLALSKIGAVIVPGAVALGPAELRDRIARARISHVIANATDTGKFDSVDGDYTRISVHGTETGAAGVDAPAGWASYSESPAAGADYIAAAPAAADPLLVYFTSGTTNKPKMVEHTQTSYPVGHLSTMYWLGVRPGDVHLAISSPGWAKHAWSLIFAPWIAEATVFVYNYTKFDAATLARELDRAGVNTFCAPPTVWRMLIQAHDVVRPRALREVLSAGEPLNPEVISRIEEMWGLTIRDGYGQTEMTASVANTPGTVVKPGSMGRPLPGVPVVLVDPATGALGDEGEICLDLAAHPFTLMTQYLDDPERNDEVMRGGFYHTGDLASRDERGDITYIGRTDDVFKSSDYKVSPFEVESLLIEHPAVVEAAVVPAPHETRLTTPKAYIVLAEGWAPDEQTARALFEHSAATMPSYMRVRRIEFAELPKTVSGKIRRVDLRLREEAAHRDGIVRDGEWRVEQMTAPNAGAAGR
ncbi:AMP-binding protein [Subtercola boreus]|uniref:AMP-dependent synthetase n=1 Tax=Subtercola boreus TaxID=120213 RepID=A0A3E0W8B2_9MICO|nr:AMP-binding protein [Subtercola boreus]RFA19061.1 AMP-dependent synthetase [Subtercola boreus]RFA19199.1 AMP-dependent synthetase [Subtercola boreus]RFA25661.1 AMP-dependent synthetase [Subtercola boreus]